ncbi:ATP-binding protein [Gaetbulibacter aestuarii]|uniref:histidine kinase n=1 Tax=Gaetbulibacter aestuarii TaxID=1502358 RepID=A0ABW7MZP0_9FLAO
MAKKKFLDFSIPLMVFVLLTAVISLIYIVALNKHYNVIDEQVHDTGKLLSKEFYQQFNSEVSKLEDLKKRLEHTKGSYFSNWEYDANLLLEQSGSFKFIEWIDSSMIIRKIVPVIGNEAALNLNISKVDYRRNEWLEHSKNGLINITPWAELTQKGNSFLVDVPVYFHDRFQGTITAGMDFTDAFDRLVDYQKNQYTVELYDDKGTLFYSVNKDKKLKSHLSTYDDSFIEVDMLDHQKWHLKVYPSETLMLAEGRDIIDVAFIFGIVLSFLISGLVYFYLRAKKGTRLAFQSYSKLIETNKIINHERDRAQKASQAKTDFLSNMSHEIRTPLHAILGFIELIKGSKLSSTNREYLNLMEKSSTNLLSIVNDVLDIEKIESGKLELHKTCFNPSEKIKELIDVNQFIFLKKDLYLQGEFPEHSYNYVMGDETKLQQIINNLLKNALKFTNTGGVTLTYNETKTINNELNINIKIKDTGIGIPSEKLDDIFERFTQIENSIKKEYQGSGLGLYICKTYANMMGGDIEVRSELNKGTEFTFNVIMPLTENNENTTSAIQKSVKFSDLEVLIVDDNSLNVIVLKKFLEDFGITPDIANNGIVALEKFKENRPQLVFMDVHMPKMDGWEATREIRKLDKEVIIFGLSANVTSEAIDKGIESGMNNYLSKPFKKDSLQKLLYFHFESTEFIEKAV